MNIKKQIYSVAAIAVAAAALVSCSGKSEGDNTVRPISDYKNMTPGDSMAYYIGQASSLDYWRVAQQDTVMQSKESRDEFMKGMRAGLDAIRDNDAYNQGYYMGVQMAMQMKEFSEDFNTSYNKTILLNAYADGLKNDSILDAGKIQQEYTALVNSLNARKEAMDKAAAEEALQKKAKSLKLQKINDILYASAGQGGEGAVLKNGDRAGISISVMDAQGHEIDRREQQAAEVGKMGMGPLSDAMLTMKIGETRTFYTYASALLGRMYQRYKLKGTDLVSFRITTSQPAVEAAGENESAN